jgi:hypothetical protein
MRTITDLLFSQPSDFSSIEGFSKKRKKKRTSGEGKNGDCWDNLRYVSQMPPYLFLLFPCPPLISVPGFHKKLHQSPYRKNFHEDGFLINNDQPFKIFFDHRRTRHNGRDQVRVRPRSIFLAFTFSTKFRKCTH